jgi:hypothetical protein
VIEPVAWMVTNDDGQDAYVTADPTLAQAGQRSLPLYTLDRKDVLILDLYREQHGEALTTLQSATSKVRASAAALGKTIAEWDRKFGAPVMDTCANVRSSSPTSGGGFVERELAVARGLAACRGDDARLDEADTELADLRQACREGWRHAAELDEERKRLQAELDRVKRYAAVALDVCTTFSEEMKDGGHWLPRWKVLAVFATQEAAAALADTLRRPAVDAA